MERGQQSRRARPFDRSRVVVPASGRYAGRLRFLQAEYLQVVALLVRDAVNQASEQQNEPTGQGVMHTVGQVLRILKDRQVAFGQKNSCWSKRSSSFYLYSICLDYSSVQIRLLVSGDTAECSIYLLIFGISAGKCCKIKEKLHGCNFCSVK